MKKYISMIASLLLVFTACSERLPDDTRGSRKEKNEVADGTPVDVKFHLGEIKCATKSIFSDDDSVNNLSILVYREGTLVTSAYTDDVNGDIIILRLAKGEQYNIYAVANCGSLTFTDETDLLTYRYTIPTLLSLGTNGFPMCWSSVNYTVSSSLPDVSIELERLVAKVVFSLDPGVLSGLEVTSVRLMQSSKVVCPFGINRAASSSSQVMAGDYASPSDLATINAGGSITMYVPENCQGTLLEGNTNPWNKVPDNISVSDRCTYIEVGCEFEDGFALSGDVTYRMYLGSDNCSNFDIIRNSIYNVSLTLTGNGLNEVSWKVDSDVDYNGSITLATAWIEEGMHENTDLYTGEIFKMGFTLNASLETLLHNKILNGSVEPQSANGKLRFVSEVTYANGNYYVDVECYGLPADHIHLYDTDTNREVCDLLQCTLRKPVLRTSTSTRSETITENLSEVTPVINGTSKDVYIYLVDASGANLLGSNQYAFNTSLFSDIACTTSVNITGYESALQSCDETRTYTNSTRVIGEGQPLASFNLSLSIPVHTSDLATTWAHLYGLQRRNSIPLKYRFSSANTSSAVNLNGYFDIIKPTISWDLLSDREVGVMAIVNPSNIEIKSEYWEIGPGENNSYLNNKSSYTAVTTTGYSGMTNATRSRTNLPVLYIHKSSFSTKEQCQNYSTIATSGYTKYEYLFQQDFVQNTSNWEVGKVVISTIDDETFDYDYSANYDEDFQTDDYNPYLYQYMDYSTPYGNKLIVPAIRFNNGSVRNPYTLWQASTPPIKQSGYEPVVSWNSGSNYEFKDFVEMYNDRASRARTKINITYSNYGLVATITSNPYNIQYNIAVEDGSVTGTCKWRSYSTASYTTNTHTIHFPLTASTNVFVGYYQYSNVATTQHVISGTSANTALSSAEIYTAFKDLNIGCWHNASEKAVAASGNRQSNFTLPQSMTVRMQACGVSRMVPVDITINGVITSSTTSTSSTVQGTIYANTNAGIYSKDYYNGTNIDNTDRDKKSINSEEVVTSSNAVTSSSKSYTLNYGVGTTMTTSFTYYVR